MRIGLLTSGGDAPGMNACIRAVVRVGICEEFEIAGIMRGYAGLLAEEIVNMDARSVADIITRGGTMLFTSRCEEFHKEEVQKRAVEILRSHGIDALVVIGGDGSFRGALALAKYGMPVIGIPATIDRDLPCTDYTIGFDTAVNTAMEAIDKIRDTSSSHERCSVVEVMGRSAGYIATWCGIACGAEEILITETYDYDENAIISRMRQKMQMGKKQHIIINAEGVGFSAELARHIEKATGIETRASILGYLQRGGSPTCKDRVYASIMGTNAIRCLKEGRINRAILYRSGEFIDEDLETALAMEKSWNPEYSEMCKKLIR